MDIIKIVLTSFFSAATLFVISKIIGHKQMAQLDLFDYITGITIGSIGAEMATELEKPLYPFVAMVVYGAVTVILTAIASKFPKTRKLINGTPTIIIDGGKIYRDNMKKAKLDLSELMVMCRMEGYFDLSDIETAVFEYNGKLTILPKSLRRPITPEDMSLRPPRAQIATEVIMDGKVLDKNLTGMGLDVLWLKKELKRQGYGSPREVFLAVCDKDNNLTVFMEH